MRVTSSLTLLMFDRKQYLYTNFKNKTLHLYGKKIKFYAK